MGRSNRSWERTRRQRAAHELWRSAGRDSQCEGKWTVGAICPVWKCFWEILLGNIRGEMSGSPSRILQVFV